MNIIITGEQGIGKTKLVQDILNHLDREAGGITVEKKMKGETIQELYMKDIGSGETHLLASQNLDNGPEVHNFHINVDTINELAKQAIDNAIRKGHLIIIDMVGQIEMHSSLFRESVRDAFRGKEDVIAIIEEEYVHEFENEGTVLELQQDNYNTIKDNVLTLLQQDTDST